MLGVRRNFVQRNWRVVPYVEARGGVGYTDAKGPEGVKYAQGQDLTIGRAECGITSILAIAFRAVWLTCMFPMLIYRSRKSTIME
jgi:hypothetical protein